MKNHSHIVLAVLLFGFAAFTVSAHPGSGIVVDEQGNVFFADLDRGVLKIDGEARSQRFFPRRVDIGWL